MTTPDMYLSPVIKLAQKEVRRLRKKWLKEILDNKDKVAIFSYCYHQAINKKFIEGVTDLALYGRSECLTTEAEAIRIASLTNLWYQRFIRWFNLPATPINSQSSHE